MHLRIILRFGFTLVRVVIMLYAYKILICMGTTRFLRQKKNSFRNLTAQELKAIFYSSLQHWKARSKYYKTTTGKIFSVCLFSLQIAVIILERIRPQKT